MGKNLDVSTNAYHSRINSICVSVWTISAFITITDRVELSQVWFVATYHQRKRKSHISLPSLCLTSPSTEATKTTLLRTSHLHFALKKQLSGDETRNNF